MASPPSRLIGFDTRRIDIADYNLRAALRKEQCRGATNASTPAGNKRDFV
jgi:hypothetical protein